jgi:glycosyltransferase involved in cell wall biosynthesis
MKIGIDVRYLSHGLVGGVHAYVKSFLPELLRQAIGHEIVLYADTKRPFELHELPANVTLRLLPYRNPLSSFSLDLFMRRSMEEDRIDVAHFPANYGFGPRTGRSIITLHDEINILPLRKIISGHRKDPRTMAMMTYLHVCSTAAIRQADLVITVSEYAKQQIAKYSRMPGQRIVPIYHGRASDLQRIDAPQQLHAVRSRYRLEHPFILGDALKNPAVVLRAWRQIPESLRAQHRIVLFSRRPDPPQVVRDAVAEGIVQLLIRPSREDLICLFSMAEAFVFPSWIEGFGIPLLEAMTCGAPVIASDRGAIPEVLGGAGLIVDAEDDQQLAKHIQTVLTDRAVSADMRQRGFARATDFSWAKTASSILSCYEQVVPTPGIMLTS